MIENFCTKLRCAHPARVKEGGFGGLGMVWVEGLGKDSLRDHQGP